MTSIVIVIGTRPELIKSTPVVRQLIQSGYDVELLFSGQHPASYMAKCAKDLALNARWSTLDRRIGWREDLERGITSLSQQLAVAGIVVVGDTDTAYGAAQVARRNSICTLVHLEAGLRLSEVLEPEEANRRAITNLADLHVAPTSLEELNLVSEGTQKSKILVAGDFTELALDYRMTELGWRPVTGSLAAPYWVATIHRRSNLVRLPKVAEFLNSFSRALKAKVLLCERRDTRLGELYRAIDNSERVHVIRERSPHQFFRLLSGSVGVITDSAGVQQEAILGGLPTVVLREDVELYKDHDLLRQCGDMALSGTLISSLMKLSTRWSFVGKSVGGRVQDIANFIVEGL